MYIVKEEALRHRQDDVKNIETGRGKERDQGRGENEGIDQEKTGKDRVSHVIDQERKGKGNENESEIDLVKEGKSEYIGY